MTSRRQLLRGVAGTLSVFGGLRWGGLVAPADAQANETASDSDASGDDAESSDADEGDPTGLPGYTVGQIYLRYEEHVGITTFVELENQNESNEERVRLEADAYGPNDTLGTDGTWEDIPAPFEQAVKLRIDNVFDLYNAVDNVTELVIRGRVPDGETDVIAAFSGSRFQKGIESDGPTEPDGGTDAAVEVQEGETGDATAGDTETAADDETEQSGDTTSDEGAGTDTASGVDPANQTGVDVSNPEDVVSTGDDGESDGGGDGGTNDDGGDNESGGGGGLLESLSFGVFGG
jgi:hypothetical protein